MEDERVVALEQALSELQTRDVSTQTKLNLILEHISSLKPPTSSPLPETDIPILRPTPSMRGPPPALPNEFDGNRTKGLAFLRSCQTYIRLCSDNFSDDQMKIVWALSYMKEGRAAKWAARIFRWEEDHPGSRQFADWQSFCDSFKTEFCPSHTDIAAINRLESVAYFQNKRSVDEYLDEFLDLITEAGYTDPKTIVVKFRRGLEPRIQDAIATMTSGRPADEVPAQWYNASRTLDQNRATNEAFRSSYRPPNPIPSHPRQSVPGIVRPPAHAHANPSPGYPVPMDVDAARKKASLPLTCYRCGQPGHRSTECDLRFDIRALSVDELQSFLKSKLAELDKVKEDDQVEIKEDRADPQEQDFADRSE